MTRTVTLPRFLLRDLFRSLTAIVPLALALAFGIIAFEYGMDQAQLITVGGVGIGAICVLTTALLAGRANRAAMQARVKDVFVYDAGVHEWKKDYPWQATQLQ